MQPLGICVIDDHSRLIAHLQWYASAENTECLVHCFSQAIQRRGLPRLLHNDNGSAMIAGEFAQGLDRLGIDYRRIQAGKAWQNGKQETLWQRVEERLLAMLKGEPNLSLERLNLFPVLPGLPGLDAAVIDAQPIESLCKLAGDHRRAIVVV